MPLKMGVVMDPVGSIAYKKDSTLAMLWEAQDRGCEIFYFELKDLLLRDGVPYGNAKRLTVFRDPNKWYEFHDTLSHMPLADLDVILMRKDPPFNKEYIYSTYILEHAEHLGVLIVNRPQALRDSNEKLTVTYFPQCAPPTLVTESVSELKAFLKEFEDIVCKPLDSMGGISVFRLKKDDTNANVVFDLLTSNGSGYLMAQQFIADITKGDKRILLINGKPIPHVLARVPQGDDWRGNLAVGAKGQLQALTERDHFICARVGPLLRERGLYFVGLDIIGDYLTEINVTSPTGIREIDAAAKTNISAMLMNWIEKKVRH